MSSVLLFSEMKQSLFFIRFRMDLPRRVAGGVNSGAEGVFVQRRLGEDHRLPLGMGGCDLLHRECAANGIVDVDKNK